MTDPAAIAVYRGPAHVIVSANETYLTAAGFDPRGMPYREAFPQPEYGQIADLFDEVYLAGIITEAHLRTPHGVARLVIAPVWQGGQVCGVATHWQERPHRAGAGCQGVRRPLVPHSVLRAPSAAST